ncbi:fungal specific transcription factor [Colletotrichum costaricense]|uniref:Fungal specific transcription factor n=1 Tax=Colletotrichum costaricense TaxID=1209916 RepID=A0AAI9YMK1_9PEZI|nr:fungal specific transcription factor [Colletotrichum costaricense]KAK1516886.1 fungal specific transcription factor [Colletotrichum costaricense]
MAYPALAARPRPPGTPTNVSSQPQPSASRRRDKPQLSCNSCRRRKIRCDRQRPCRTCSCRGQDCVYPETNDTIPPPKVTSSGAPNISLQDRLVHLEQLVTMLGSSENRTSQIGTPANIPTPIDDRSETGSMRSSAMEHQYVGSEHWSAIMESIADLKDHFDREEQSKLAESPTADYCFEDQSSFTQRRRWQRPLLLYGCQPAASRSEILSTLPPKNAVDRYISRYFNRLDLVSSSSVHGPTFLKEYEQFWRDPNDTSTMWIGLLFSMICLAVIASDPSTDASEDGHQQLQIELYREKLVQCLLMGEYTQGGDYALETFMNYVYVEFRIHDDAQRDVWFLLGLEVNLAKRMGYHRDPKHFPEITPLKAEMRRRVWATVLLGDILISGQMGMPRMVRDGEFDTAEPRNLNDEDLHGEMTSLPPPRPETEHTTALGIIARRRLLIALGTISDLAASLSPSSYADIMRLDGILEQAYNNIPLPLRMKSMASSVTDSPQVIMARLFLRHMFCEGKIMLHRRFLFAKSTIEHDDTYSYSRTACLDAALGMLQIQQTLDEETCPGGQLFMMHWRVGSIMNHHFLTATMVLCSLVYQRQTLGRENEILTALRTARSIWMRKAEDSVEAKKASQAVSIVLARAGGPRFDATLVADRPIQLLSEPIANSKDAFLEGLVGDQVMLDEHIFLTEAFMSDERENGMDFFSPFNRLPDELPTGRLCSKQSGGPASHGDSTISEWVIMGDQGQYQ